jgi:hypothetical protein
MTNARYVVAAVLMLGGCFSAAAQNAPEKPPVADKGTTAQGNCIDENDGYTKRGGKPMFVIQLDNKCEQRIVCKVFANVSSAKGNALGHGTIRLAPKSQGTKAKGSWSMPVKMSGGNSQSARECRAI